MSETVAILGASSHPERYAWKANQLLREKGHRTLLINPAETTIDGQPVLPSLDAITEPVDTLTLYVNPRIAEQYQQQIINLKPRRVIFNPGTESEPLVQALEAAGIATEEACTLVLLRTHQF